MKCINSKIVVCILIFFSSIGLAEESDNDKLALKQKQIRYGLNNDMFSYFDFSAKQYFKYGLYNELSKTITASLTTNGYVHDVIDKDMKYPYFAVGNGRIASTGAKDHVIKIHDLETGKLLFNIKKSYRSSSDSTDILVISDDLLISASLPIINIRKLSDGKLLRSIDIGKNSGRYIYDLAIYNNKIFASFGSNSRGRGAPDIRVWDLSNGKFIKKITYQKKNHTAYDFTNLAVQQKKVVAIALNGRRICIFNSHTGKLINQLNYKDQIANDISLYKGKIVAAYNNGNIIIWDLNSGKIVKTLQSNGKKIRNIAVSNEHIFSSDENSILIWDFDSGSKLFTMDIHHKKVLDIKLASGFIISSSLDETIRKTRVPAKENTVAKSKFKQEAIKYFNNTLFEGDQYEAALALPIAKLINLTLFKQRHSDALLVKNKLRLRSAFKNGKIGERQVPYTSSSYTSYDNDYVIVDGKSINYSTSKDHSSSNGGYKDDIYGYKAIYEIKNNSTDYYLVDMKSTWTGTYSKYVVKNYGAWSNKSGSYSELRSKKMTFSYPQSFILAPEEKFKYQFELGEEKPIDLLTTPVSITVIKRPFYEGLIKSMEKDNRDIALIERYLKSNLVSNWHPQLRRNKKRIIQLNNDEFSSAHIDNVKISLKYDSTDYDPVFENSVIVIVESSEPLKVDFTTPFAKKSVNISEKSPVGFGHKYRTSIKFNVTGIPKSELKAKINYVWPL